jgi:hypothetical protein
LSVTTGITCRASKQFTLPDTREEGKNEEKKQCRKKHLFLSYFLFLTASEVNNKEDLCQGKEKEKKNMYSDVIG